MAVVLVGVAGVVALVAALLTGLLAPRTAGASPPSLTVVASPAHNPPMAGAGAGSSLGHPPHWLLVTPPDPLVLRLRLSGGPVSARLRLNLRWLQGWSTGPMDTSEALRQLGAAEVAVATDRDGSVTASMQLPTAGPDADTPARLLPAAGHMTLLATAALARTGRLLARGELRCSMAVPPVTVLWAPETPAPSSMPTPGSPPAPLQLSVQSAGVAHHGVGALPPARTPNAPLNPGDNVYMAGALHSSGTPGAGELGAGRVVAVLPWGLAPEAASQYSLHAAQGRAAAATMRHLPLPDRATGAIVDSEPLPAHGTDVVEVLEPDSGGGPPEIWVAGLRQSPAVLAPHAGPATLRSGRIVLLPQRAAGAGEEAWIHPAVAHVCGLEAVAPEADAWHVRLVA